MRRTLRIAVAAPLLALALPAAAQQFAQPHPLSEKYSDLGAKPATGRSGIASLAVRALLGRSGTTDLEVTTGELGAAAAPPGRLAKVQVKRIGPQDLTMQTDNYSLSGGGYIDLPYTGLHRGEKVQVQTNVRGIDRARTDVVTVATDVKLRPDLEAAGVNAPASVPVNTSVLVTGVVTELNGDVGAHGACRLFVDGNQIDAIPGIWVDAGSTVSCRFHTSFATPGVRNVVVRVTDVVPADDDPGNNAFAARIEVVDPVKPWDWMQVGFLDYVFHNSYVRDAQFSGYDGSVGSQHFEVDSDGHMQDAIVIAGFAAGSAVDSGRIAWRFTMDGVPFQQSSVDVAALPGGWSFPWETCRFGVFADGMDTVICGSAGGTVVYVERVAGRATYVMTYSGTGVWYGGWQIGGVGFSGPARVMPGAVFAAEVTHEHAGVTHSGVLSAALRPLHDVGQLGPYCGSYTFTSGVETYCETTRYDLDMIHGNNFRRY